MYIEGEEKMYERIERDDIPEVVTKVAQTTTYRIQLASNFQVVEFNLDIKDYETLTVEDSRIAEAITLVNKLGKMVENTIKTKEAKANEKKETEVKVEEMASEGQIKWLKNLGISEADAKKMTKKEAWQKIQDSKK